MSIKYKKLLSISLAFAILMTILSQSACRKENYVSLKDFINNIKGEWYVSSLSYSDIPVTPSSLEVNITVSEDRISYKIGNEQQYYLFDDTILCTLPHTEKIQNWTITENNQELFLEATDICGEIKNYKVQCSNYQYDIEMGHVSENVIVADISLINQDTLLTLNAFFLDSAERMGFDIVTSNSRDSFILLRGQSFH